MPLAGHDTLSRIDRIVLRISIHVPLAGHDNVPDADDLSRVTFQSTCPLRGTTKIQKWLEDGASISIHVPLAGHDKDRDCVGIIDDAISIHVPLAGHDFSSIFS